MDTRSPQRSRDARRLPTRGTFLFVAFLTLAGWPPSVAAQEEGVIQAETEILNACRSSSASASWSASGWKR